jgi:hypothetical protein
MILAVNGGMYLFQRQVAQKAADAASLAGALALTQGYSVEQIESIVLDRAKDQGFDTNDSENLVELSWMSEILGAGASFSNHLQVEITTEYSSLFSTLFNSERSLLTVDAVAHARMHEDLAPGYAVVSLNDEQCQESQSGTNSDSAGSRGGCWEEIASGGNTLPVPVTGGTQVTLTDVPIPDCSGLVDYGDVLIQDAVTLQPGMYASITVEVGASLNLNPGLYCIYGSGFDGNSILMSEASWVVGQDVMVYLMEGAGNFRTSPTTATYLYAPESLLDQSGQQWGGMLVYAHPDNESEFIFTGTSKTTYRGTI